MIKPTKLRIALLTYATKPRGSVIHSLELASALHTLGHQVCIYALDKDGTGFNRSLSCNFQLIPAQPAPAEMDALIQQRIQEFIDYLTRSELTYDIYHAQDCISANALAILQKQQKIPHFIRTVHHIEDYTSPYLQQCQERSIREAEMCLCVSDEWQSQLKEHYQIHAPRVTNGINTQHFSANTNGWETQLKQRLKLTGYPIYLTVGGIEPRKNSIKLLQAFSRVLGNYASARLVIAGGATVFDYQSYREEFWKIAGNLGIKMGQSLLVTGIISHTELPVLYRCADAFVFPSIKEGWGLVILEAIASGLPVITANIPPFTEFLNPEQALLINPDSVTELAQAMQLICQPSLANSLIQKSQAILSDYSWSASAKTHLHNYFRLLNKFSISAKIALIN